jgi:hypothetical protein
LGALASGQSLLGNPQALYQAAVALANQTTQGPLNALAAQLAANNKQTTAAEKLTGGYFNALGQQAQGALNSEGTIAGNLNSQLANIGNSTQSQLQGLGQNAQDALSRYTPQSDGSFASPAMQSLTAEIARQRGLAAQQQGAAQTAGAEQGANYQGLAASNVGTGALYGREALSNIAQAGQLKNQGVESQIAALKATRGADITKNLGDLRQQEITNALTSQGLGLKNAQFAATLKNDAANRQAAILRTRLEQAGMSKREAQIIAGQTMRTRIEQQGANQRAAAAQQGENARNAASIAARQAAAQAKASGTGGTKPLTTLEQNSLFRTIGEMQALIKQGIQAGHSHGQISQALQTGQLQKGFPAQSLPLINAAFELVNYGYIWPHTAQALRQMGLRPEQHGLKVQQPAKSIPGIGQIP